MQNKTNILLIYTGGTIGMVKDDGTGILKAFNFGELIKKHSRITSIGLQRKRDIIVGSP